LWDKTLSEITQKGLRFSFNSYDQASRIIWVKEKGIVLNELARYEEAVESFDLFLKFVSLPQVRQLRENSLLDALAGYDRILAENPGNVEALLKRGDILHRLHRYGDAVHSYNRALEMQPKNLDAFNRRGNAFLALDWHEEALESYDRALETAPRKAVLLF
jgi:tetratricopeptide (TPR) repeat protein